MKPEASVWEIYSAVQGEGLTVGERQVFLRLAGCNLDCRFCDTPAREGEVERCAVEALPGAGRFEDRPNPLSAEQAVDAVLGLARGEPPASTVSVTGGEPLLWPEFLRSVAETLTSEGITVHLETNGTLPDALEGVTGLCDWIAMDMKLPSSAGVDPLWDVHQGFLALACATRVFVKTVVTSDTTDEDFRAAVRVVRGVDRTIPMVLQPVTPARGVGEPVPRTRILRFESIAAEALKTVRVIPQVHRVLGER